MIGPPIGWIFWNQSSNPYLPNSIHIKTIYHFGVFFCSTSQFSMSSPCFVFRGHTARSAPSLWRANVSAKEGANGASFKGELPDPRIPGQQQDHQHFFFGYFPSTFTSRSKNWERKLHPNLHASCGFQGRRMDLSIGFWCLWFGGRVSLTEHGKHDHSSRFFMKYGGFRSSLWWKGIIYT